MSRDTQEQVTSDIKPDNTPRKAQHLNIFIKYQLKFGSDPRTKLSKVYESRELLLKYFCAAFCPFWCMKASFAIQKVSFMSLDGHGLFLCELMSP